MPSEKQRRLWMLFPVFGALIFLMLYFVAALLYPGGSQLNPHSAGFSWKDNYWCNLTNEYAINGKPNTAKPIAVTAMFILCISILFFWLLFAQQIKLGKSLSLIIRVSGTLSMGTAFLLVTGIDHDLITNLASVLGLIATSVVFIGLYKEKWMQLFVFGLGNVLLVFMNNYVYYTKDLIIYLPVIQKISFVFFLSWMCCINITLFRRATLPAVPSA